MNTTQNHSQSGIYYYGHVLYLLKLRYSCGLETKEATALSLFGTCEARWSVIPWEYQKQTTILS